MNSVVEARVESFLRNWLHHTPLQAQVIVQTMQSLARPAGHALDERFARAGLGAGPECRIAAGILDRALLGGGAETSDYAIKQEIAQWLRKANL